MRTAERGSLSARSISIIAFILAMSISIGVIGHLVFTNWIQSSGEIMRFMADDMSRNINQRIDALVSMPEIINRYNAQLLASGAQSLSDENSRDQFFAGVLNLHRNEIFGFYYCSVSGEFYGARNMRDGGMEIQFRSDTTGGIRRYAVKNDLTAGEFIGQTDAYDPRQSAWYKAAINAGGPTYSPVYQDFESGNLVVSAAEPVIDESGNLRGVLVVDVLLSDLSTRLRGIASDTGGYAYIVEAESGALVGNSLSAQNFTISPDGVLKRNMLDEINDPLIAQAYKRFHVGQDAQMFLKKDDSGLYISARAYRREGLNWLVISAVPESFLMAEVRRNIQMTLALIIIAIILSAATYYAIARFLTKPLDNLLEVAEHIAAGSLSERAVIVRNDEIGRISRAFNKTADKMQYLINNLEEIVSEKTADLEESKDRLRLLLDSTAEAIFGMDTQGNCTFCNISCLRLLGYASEDDLLGRNIHRTIHHTRADGTIFPIEECLVLQSISRGKGVYADDEVFWKADDTCFFVEYNAHPQTRDGVVIGAVVTFTDITERKKRDEEIRYLSCHDVLTGLHNRRCFQDSLPRIDIPENLPISVIFADLNGLKMTNDIFGHAAGDALIVKASEILVNSCGEGDRIARVGGDEFVVILPRTCGEDARGIIKRIRAGFASARVEAVQCSISLGSDTKTTLECSIEETIANAENAMYKDKNLNRKSIDKGMIDTIMETLYEKSPKERQHSIGVSDLCGRIGTAMRLSEAEIARMRKAGYLHDIGKIVLEEHILHWDDLAEEERERIHQHSAVGYRILSLFNETLDLADGVYSHHERWDGTGYPKGLKGNEIPLLSRVISIAETYERVLSGADAQTPGNQESAIQVIWEGAGRQFDPEIASLFIEMIEKETVTENNCEDR